MDQFYPFFRWEIKSSQFRLDEAFLKLLQVCQPGKDLGELGVT